MASYCKCRWRESLKLSLYDQSECSLTPQEVIILLHQLESAPVTSQQISWTAQDPALTWVLQLMLNGWPDASCSEFQPCFSRSETEYQRWSNPMGHGGHDTISKFHHISGATSWDSFGLDQNESNCLQLLMVTQMDGATQNLETLGTNCCIVMLLGIASSFITLTMLVYSWIPCWLWWWI